MAKIRSDIDQGSTDLCLASPIRPAFQTYFFPADVLNPQLVLFNNADVVCKNVKTTRLSGTQLCTVF